MITIETIDWKNNTWLIIVKIVCYNNYIILHIMNISQILHKQYQCYSLTCVSIDFLISMNNRTYCQLYFLVYFHLREKHYILRKTKLLRKFWYRRQFILTFVPASSEQEFWQQLCMWTSTHLFYWVIFHR